MTSTITKNLTRYNSEDLEALLYAIEGASVSFTGGWRTEGRQRTLYSYRDIVEPLYGDCSGTPGMNYGNKTVHHDPQALAYFTETKLFLRSPGAIAVRYPLEALAAAGEGIAPGRLVRAIIAAAVHAALDGSVKKDSAQPSIERLYDGFASKHSIRIMDGIETPEKKGGLSLSEKVSRLRGDGFFGTGGALYGPDSGGRSGTRSATYQWEVPLDRSEEMYSRELQARQKYEQLLQGMGEETESYETWPEYLRRVADSYEKAAQREAAGAAQREADRAARRALAAKESGHGS